MYNIVFLDEPFIHQMSEKFKNMNLVAEDTRKTVLSIDIGILNLGISVGVINDEYKIDEIMWVDLINITKYTHERELDKDTCTLNHTKSIADWLEHVFEEHIEMFEGADYILVERQPPMGLVAVEQIIYYRWRSKCHLISPNSMHKHFRIGHYDYEQRKEQTQRIAQKMWEWHPRALDRYSLYERKHDMTDSICLMAFWLHKKHLKYIETKRKNRIMHTKVNKDSMTTDKFLEQFRQVN